MDLNEIFVFAKVVDTRSFSAAAKILGLPKSTVSRKVAQLEERLGAQLLHRTTRKLQLTEVGAAYYQRCARVTAELAEAEREVLEMQNEPKGRLRLSGPTEFSFLAVLASQFMARYPGIELDIDLTGRHVDLIEEGFHLAIRAGQVSDPALIARKLGDALFLLCAAPSYLERHGTPRTIDDLEDHECIIFGVTQRRYSWRLRRLPRSEGQHRLNRGQASEAGRPAARSARITAQETESGQPEELVDVPIKGRFSTSSLATVREAAIAGLGIAMLPPPLCNAALATGQLHEVLQGVVPPQGSVYAVYPTTHRHSLKVRAFMDHLNSSWPFLPWADPATGLLP